MEPSGKSIPMLLQVSQCTNNMKVEKMMVIKGDKMMINISSRNGEDEVNRKLMGQEKEQNKKEDKANRKVVRQIEEGSGREGI